MTPGTFVVRSLRYFWRVNLAVAIGVGVAVAALAGALVVGASVRASLRELALSRLGNTGQIVTATVLFTEQLAERVSTTPQFKAWTGAVPVLALEGVVVHETSRRRAGGVQVFGVDDRFWQFHGIAGVEGPPNRDAFMSEGLARELGASPEDSLLLRIQKPSTIPAGLLQGRRDEPGRAVRLRTARVLTRAQMGDFSPRPQQGEARTIFIPLERLQRDIQLPHRVNMLLFGARTPSAGGSQALTTIVLDAADLADLGVRTRPVAGPAIAVESDAGFLTEAFAKGAGDAARAAGVEPVPVLTYLATTIRAANGRETPYSLVSALPQAVIEAETVRLKPDTTNISTGNSEVESGFSRTGTKPIWLSQWTADDLQAKPGDAITIDYQVWSDQEGLAMSKADFVLAGILPMSGLAIDRDLTPEYPGLSDSANIGDWDPPFPVDLSRVRKLDEEYWDKYRTAPKAFIRIEDGQSLWQSRYGSHTSIRVPAGARTPVELHAALGKELPQRIPPSVAEFRAIAVRDDALTAASGTTDFGEYFTYFSFFLVVSSLLLTMLFFRLGIEQRAHEIGLLGALGYAPRTIARLLLAEGTAVAIVGALLGVAGALAYSSLIMLALRTLWVGAVGTTELQVYASPLPLAAGAVGGILAAVGCILWTLRVLRRASARQLMSGGWLDAGHGPSSPSRRVRLAAIGGAVLALVLVAVTALGLIPPAAGFFGSGSLLLVAGLCGLALWLRSTGANVFAVKAWPLLRFGVRNARYRPARSVLSVALIAAATFLIVSVGAFRRGAEDLSAPHSGSGGYRLIAETMAPLMHDPATPAGRESLNLGPELDGLQVARFRLRPGDDASCLNLYRPQSPRLLGATPDFISQGRFSFAGSIADTDEERANPWLLLNRRFDDGAVPVIGDATSLTYAFHLGVGDDYEMDGPDGRPLRLRIVAALRDSVLQSELILGDQQFTRLFPRNEGFRVFLMSPGEAGADAVAAALEDRLQDFGMDVQSTDEKLASFHRVENTFLSTFQALGALGLVLGTFGLGTVLLRNVLERRRELALLRATGYRRSDLVTTVIAESVFLLACGLLLGVACALVAIAPAYAERGQEFPFAATLALLAAVFGSGLLSTVVATRAVASSALLPALKNE